MQQECNGDAHQLRQSRFLRPQLRPGLALMRLMRALHSGALLLLT